MTFLGSFSYNLLVSLPISEDFSFRITLGAIGVALCLVFGFSAWMTSINASAESSRESIKRLEDNEPILRDLLISIDKRLLRIEVLLEKQTKGQ